MTPVHINSKFRLLVIVLVVLFSAAACSSGDKGDKVKVSKIDVNVEVIEATPEATDEATPEATDEATPEATDEATPEATDEATPEATEVASDDDMEVIVVIEGPVEKIEGNIITIFNIDIQLEENDPILVTLKIDDVLHVEGTTLVMGDTVIIVVVNIYIINVPIIIYEDAPSNCRVTPKGKVKCTKRRS